MQARILELEHPVVGWQQAQQALSAEMYHPHAPYYTTVSRIFDRSFMVYCEGEIINLFAFCY